MKTIEITYNRQDKKYNWIDDNGVIYSFPAKQKHEAFKFAVSMLEPDLYQAATLIIENTPQIERLVWKAVQLVTDGKVEILTNPVNGVVAMVDSSDEFGRYAITQDVDQKHCNCISFTQYPQYDQHGTIHCKHTLATRLSLVARTDY